MVDYGDWDGEFVLLGRGILASVRFDESLEVDEPVLALAAIVGVG
jgi:hypothetical protein